MHLEVSFRNLRPREEVRVRAQALFQKLERFLDQAAEAQLTVAAEHNMTVVEMVLTTRGEVQKVTEEDEDMRTALDRLFHTMEVNLRRVKERQVDRRHRGAPELDGFQADSSED